MKPTAMVVTTAHWPDDTRIRERLIRSLSEDFRVVYAAPVPGPSDRAGLEFVKLKGGRFQRNFRGLVICLRRKWDVLVLHDPETLLMGFLARLVREKPVVFDVHEDVPATALTREWVPAWLRRPLAWALRRLLHAAERVMAVTLAEPGYQHLFKGSHPTFANFPDTSGYPAPVSEGNGEAVYLGDATMQRGVDLAVDACAQLGVPLRLIGRLPRAIETQVLGRGLGAALVVEGVVPNPEAIRLLSTASVGLAPLRDIPNYQHSQPTKVLEYLAMGIPVVASDLPGTRSMVEGLEGVFLVTPGDPGALADGITAALAAEIREVTVGQASEVRERFRWPGAEVRDFYRSLV